MRKREGLPQREAFLMLVLTSTRTMETGHQFPRLGKSKGQCEWQRHNL